MKRKLILCISVLALVACSQNAEKGSDDAAISVDNNVKTEVEFRGAQFDADEQISLESLVQDLKSNDSVLAVVEAKVTEVCQAKGCWMKVDLPSGESMRVTFKDYAFFMPKDLAGRTVTIKGVAKKEETDVETLKHFAEDAGKSTEEIAAIIAPEMNYKFVASCVRLDK